MLALMLLVVPAIGMHGKDLLQGSLKAILIVFFVLGATTVFVWPTRSRPTQLVFHRLLWLPLSLLAYALGSMAWSHTYLAGVEVVRWFVFSLIVFLGLNTFTLARVHWVAWGIHAGAVLAALWTALQFWFDWQYFPQAVEPASTFVNRNFFAEYLICTLPFSVLLLTRLRSRTAAYGLTFSIAFNVVALMMTGTRSALVSLLILGPLLPAIAMRYSPQWSSSGWRPVQRLGLGLVFIATVWTLGAINTTNARLGAESGYGDAIDRTLKRSLSVTQADEYSEGSSSQRLIMWKGTARMIAAHPLAGVGAGAWEVQIPLYQEAGSQVEYSDYPHNELLQLLAEYGLVGGLLLAALLAYLLRTAFTTWRDGSPQGLQEAPLRAFVLASLLALLLVSNAGFPWHMATTCALFALCLALLAASDVRLATARARWSGTLAWPRKFAWLAVSVTTLVTALALYVTQQAVASEARLLQAQQLAGRILQSGQPEAAIWAADKTRLLHLLREGIALNPHHRQLSAEIADTLASWGDLKNARWVWESVLASRPHIVVMLAYVARAHLLVGEPERGKVFYERALALQPTAPVVQALQVMWLSRTGHEAEAMRRAAALLQAGVIDPDLVSVAYALGLSQHQPALAILALERSIVAWPEQAAEGWLLLGGIYDSAVAKDEARALQAYRAAWQLTPAAERDQLLASLPERVRGQLANRQP